MKKSFECNKVGKCSKCDVNAEILWTFKVNDKSIMEDLCGDCALEKLASEESFVVSDELYGIICSNCGGDVEVKKEGLYCKVCNKLEKW